MLIEAEWVLKSSYETIWETLNAPNLKVELVCADGILETTGREIIFSQFAWEYQRRFPKTPVLKAHVMPRHPRLNKKTSMKLIQDSFWCAYDTYGGELDLVELSQMAYDITNAMYNFIVDQLPEYVTSLSALDFIGVLTHPVVAEANAKVQPTQASIDRNNRTIGEVLMDENELKGNRIAESSKSALTSLGQVLQVTGSRGYLTDIDSTIFRYPILPGYGSGIHSLHDHAIESRSCSKALFFAKYPLSDVEYLNRQLQMSGEYIRHVFEGDCGSEILLPLPIKSKKDLKTFQGKYYYPDDDSKRLYRILPSDEQLVGKTVMVRSPTGCLCLPKQGVCQVCLGEIALQIQKGGNLGHLSTIELCSGVSQAVLSTKHLDGSAHTKAFIIHQGDEPYLSYGRRENTIQLKQDLAGKTIKLIVSREAAYNLTEINHVQSLQDTQITRISEIEFVTLEITDQHGNVKTMDVVVSNGSQKSSFTIEFLAFLRKISWYVNEAQAYEFDISNWDFSKPVFELPLKHANVMEFMSEVSNIVRMARLSRRRRKQSQELANNMDAMSGLILSLHDKVNERFSLNFAHCEVIMAVSLVRDPIGGDFRFPDPRDERGFAEFKQIMQYRSVPQSLSHQEQANRILDYRAFTIKKRPSHPMDAVYIPPKLPYL